MRINRSIPPATVIPVLVYPDVRAAVAWLTTAFGFVERVRIGDDHRSQLHLGTDGAVIIADVHGERRPPSPGTETHLLKVRVEDVDERFERARAHGARVIEEPADHPYGQRECTVEDLAGHRWQFSQTLRDVAPEEWGGITVDQGTDDHGAGVNRRAAALFAAIDDYEEQPFIAAVDALAAELPDGDADALFHRACARDSWGHSDLAVPLYRQALARGGLTGENRRRAVIQLASSLRNVGDAETALTLLTAERDRGCDHLDDALTCVTALCLASLGRDREALSLTITALAAHLPRYNRSMTAYAQNLL